MSTTTTTTTAAPLSAAEFRRQSFAAYVAYVDLIEGKSTVAVAIKSLAPLCALYGLQINAENLVNLLTVRMTAYGTDAGEKARKVKSIATFRAFVKGGWRDVAAAPVHSNAGKDPFAAAAKKAAKAKKPTRADLEAELAALKAQLAAKA